MNTSDEAAASKQAQRKTRGWLALLVALAAIAVLSSLTA
jgi:hypothetical protein